MSHTIKGTVQVDLRADGVDYSGTYGPGDAELPEPVAELLTAQGLATPAKGKSPKATDQDAAPAAAPSTDTTTED